MNLFDLADNDLYRQYSRRSVAAVTKYDGKVVALGKLDEDLKSDPDVEPRQAMVLVEWPSREAFQGFSTTRRTKTCTRCAKTGRETTCGGPTKAWRTCGRCFEALA